MINMSQTALRLISVNLLNGDMSRKKWEAFVIIPIFLLVISCSILIHYRDYASIFFHWNKKRTDQEGNIIRDEEGMIQVIKQVFPGGSDEMYKGLKDSVGINYGYVT